VNFPFSTGHRRDTVGHGIGWLPVLLLA